VKRAALSIWGLSAAHCVTDIYSSVLPAILPLLISQYGYSYFLAGLTITLYNLTSSFTQPLIGWLYDRRGTGVHTSVTVLICAIFISAIGLSAEYVFVLACAMCAALGHALFHPGALGAVSRLAENASRGRITAYFVVGGNLGFALGPLFAGIAVGTMGLSGLVFLVLPGLVMAGILRVVMPGTQSLPTLPGRDAAAGAATASLRPIAILVVASALRAWAIFGAMAYLPTYLTYRGFDILSANVLVTGMLIAGVIGQVVGGTLSDRYGRKEYAVFGLIGAIPAFYAFMATDGTLSLIILMVFGFTLWSTFSVTVAMAHELMPGSVGTASGLMLGLAVGAGGIGVAVTGHLADLYTLTLGLLSIPIPVIAAVLLFLAVPYPWKTLARR